MSGYVCGIWIGMMIWMGFAQDVLAIEKKYVVGTTTQVVDLVKKIGGERVRVEGLMGPGVDPHLYKASASDLLRLSKADIIFYNGLFLEGKILSVLARLAREKYYVYAVAESVPENLLLEPEAFGGHFDPHIWFDIHLWGLCIQTVRDGLTALDPEGENYFAARALKTESEFKALQLWALERVRLIPKEQRILVTSHDAYNYFGRAFGFQVVGLQGISTVSEAGLADMTKMIDYIKANKIKAIFVESSVSPKAIERVSQDSGAAIGGELFSDAMGNPGQMENGYDVGTYEGMMRHNINVIVEALKTEY